MLASLSLSAEGLATLSTQFRTCEPLNATRGDVTYFFAQMVDAWYWANIAYDAPSGSPTLGKFVLNDACPFLEGASESPLDAYAALFNAYLATPCWDVNYQMYLTDMQNPAEIDYRPLVFLVCNELSSFLTTTSADQPWFGVPTQYYVDQCFAIFGVNVTDASIAFTFNDHYGTQFLGERGGASQILVVNGGNADNGVLSRS